MKVVKAARLCAVGLAMLAAGSASAVAQEVPTSRAAIHQSFSPVVKKTAPAVVNIYTKKVVRTVASPLLNDPFFRRFFSDVIPPGMTQDRVQSSLGSGVVVESTGTVITNNHVIKGADVVTVVLADKREFEAQVVGVDERTDLAVLKIDVGNQPISVLPLGDSDAVEVGDLVLAIGNPFGVGQTVTSGIVSALARTNVGVADYRSFIQTDAAINPGNSGGALVDLNGRLIGINTAIYSKDGGSMGIGFAIPTSMVRTVLKSIQSNGKVVRPWLGASGQPVTGDLAQAMGLARPVGVVINNLYAGGPAEEAGLKVGDVVTHVNGHEVDDLQMLRFRLATIMLGESATLDLWREGQTRKVSMKAIPAPEKPARNETELAGQNPLSGAVIANLNPALAEEIGMSGLLHGVVITKIARNSIALRYRFQPRDIITKLNGKPVASVDELTKALSGKRKSWSLEVNRNGEILKLEVGG